MCRPAARSYYPGAVYNVLLFVLIVDALILGAAVLLQAGQGGGLASLGGGAGTEQFMGGRQATTLLTKVSWWGAGIFLFVSLVLAVMSSRGAAPRSVIDTEAPPPAPVQATPLPLQSTPQPAAPAAPTAPTAPRQKPQPSGKRPPDR